MEIIITSNNFQDVRNQTVDQQVSVTSLRVKRVNFNQSEVTRVQVKVPSYLISLAQA